VTAIVLESSFFELTLQCVIAGERHGFDNDIHVASCSHWRCCGIRYQQPGSAATHEDEAITQRPQRACDRIEQRDIGIVGIHARRSLNI
jgi:hypothetical protein